LRQNKNRKTAEKSLKVNTEQLKYLFLLSFASILFVLAFTFNSIDEIVRGNQIILLSPANLITDYFALASIGAALINASMMTFLSIGMVRVTRAKITGPLIAAIFTVTGFSLFGKNLYNSLPFIFGVYCHSKISGTQFKDQLRPAIFATALGPLVSEFSFNLNMPLWLGVSLGILIGFLTGLVLPILSNQFMNFHQGFNLYNVGFTCGIIGTFFIGVLRSFGVEVDTVSLLSSGNNKAMSLILYSLFSAMLLIGLASNGWTLKGYSRILSHSGRMMPDFLQISGFGPTMINMSLLGILTTSYVLFVRGELSGPVLGGILTVVGFGACGKHIKNVMPVLLGIYLVGLFNLDDVYSPFALLAALFGTTLAPISGHYGPIAGMIAGALHMTMTMNISNLHAGMNLYNNGFSGGFVAAALFPILDTFKKSLARKRLNKEQR